jgi:hypothetical protein
VVTGQDWLRTVNMDATGAMLSVPEVQSVFHRDGIDGWTGALVDQVTLAGVENALQKLFEP